MGVTAITVELGLDGGRGECGKCNVGHPRRLTAEEAILTQITDSVLHLKRGKRFVDPLLAKRVRLGVGRREDLGHTPGHATAGAPPYRAPRCARPIHDEPIPHVQIVGREELRVGKLPRQRTEPRVEE